MVTPLLLYKRCHTHWRIQRGGAPGADDIIKCIFLMKIFEFLFKFVPNGPVNNIAALVQIMIWRRPGDKPLSEPMMVSLPPRMRHSASTLFEKVRCDGYYFYIMARFN